MAQAVSLKSLALKVLREGMDSVANEKSCPTTSRSDEASGTGQSVGQMPTVQARVRGQDAVAESNQAEVCWHCHGQKLCRCALCGVPEHNLSWEKGQCRACKGTGWLCWPERTQGAS